MKQKDIALDNISVIAKLTDGAYHQVALNPNEINLVKDFIWKIQDGTIKILEKKIDGIYW